MNMKYYPKQLYFFLGLFCLKIMAKSFYFGLSMFFAQQLH